MARPSPHLRRRSRRLLFLLPLLRLLGGLLLGLVLLISLPWAALAGWLRRLSNKKGSPSDAITVHAHADADGDEEDEETGAPDDKPRPRPILSILRPASSRPDLLLPLFREHGRHCLAYASLVNPEYSHAYFEGVGSLAFVEAPGGAVMAVSDPLAPRDRWQEVARLFLAAFPRAFFGYVSADFATELARALPGARVNDWGVSTRVTWPPPCPAAAPGGGGGGLGARSAQQDARRALKSGLRVREVPLAELFLPLRQELAEVSRQWRSGKVTADRELRVFCRALDFLGEEQEAGADADFEEGWEPRWAAALKRDQAAGVRLFLAESSSSSVVVDAFLVLDPAFDGGQVSAYVLASCRARPSAHRGAAKLLVHHVLTTGALLLGKDADATITTTLTRPLLLGLAPFASLAAPADCPFGGGAAWMRLAAQFLFHCADGRLYAFQGLAAHKHHYGSGRGGDQRERRYCVHSFSASGGGGALSRLLPGPEFVAELYWTMVLVGFVGDGPVDTVLRLWGLRRA